MSDNTNTETETTTPTKKAGPKRRTESELREAFAAMKSSIGAEGLSLQVDGKGRCTVVHTAGDEAEVVLGPLAGNTFMHYINGAEALARFAG